jgi:Leucine-rich repeat (LRR) protein
LKVLQLGSNRIQNVPNQIGLLSNLQELSLHSNNIATIPPNIGLLSKLQILNLGSNQLQTIPSEIGELYLLEKLSLGGNELLQIPASIGNLSNTLDLSINKSFLELVQQRSVANPDAPILFDNNTEELLFSIYWNPRNHQNFSLEASWCVKFVLASSQLQWSTHCTSPFQRLPRDIALLMLSFLSGTQRIRPTAVEWIEFG